MTRKEKLDAIKLILKQRKENNKQYQEHDDSISIFNAGMMKAHHLVREQWRHAYNLGCIEATKVLDNMAKTIFNEIMNCKD